MTRPNPDVNAGRVVLYINQTDSRQADTGRVADWAREARQLGCDSISVKVGEGTDLWFPLADVSQFRLASLAHGAGFIPFWYSRADLDYEGEARLMLGLQRANGGHGISLDMEDTWNVTGDAAAVAAKTERAKTYAELLKPAYDAGPLYVSTWADPNQQAWQPVIDALGPVVDRFCPQQYSDWLAAQEGEFLHFKPEWLQPQFDLTVGEFGPEHPVALAAAAQKRGHETIWLWERAAAWNHQALTRQIIAAFGTEPPAV